MARGPRIVRGRDGAFEPSEIGGLRGSFFSQVSPCLFANRESNLSGTTLNSIKIQLLLVGYVSPLTRVDTPTDAIENGENYPLGATVAKRRLTVYLLDESVQDYETAVEQASQGDLLELPSKSGIEGAVAFRAAAPRTPEWMSLFAGALSEDQIPELLTAGASGILLLRASGRIFALTFGYGRSMLNLQRIEFQFGLRVVLNGVDHRHLKSLDRKTFDDMVVATSTQVSRTAEVPAFGIDTSSDILKAVTGKPRDDKFGTTISGSDSLVLSVDASLTDLPKLCEQLLHLFESSEYRAEFGWVDHLSEVRDAALKSSLNEMVVSAIKRGETSSTHFAAPEVLNWNEIEAFRLGGSRTTEYEDLDLDRYLAALGSQAEELTVERLKERRVQVKYSRIDEWYPKWPIFNCLVSEQRVGDRLFALIEGRWFSIAASLVEEIDGFLTGVETAELQFPTQLVDEVEGAYNQRVAQQSAGGYLLLDARTLRARGARSGIEFCDLLSSGRNLVHVKRKTRSATLSHLFSQGFVSFSTFLQDQTYRESLRAYIEGSPLPEIEKERWLGIIPGPTDALNASDYTVSYVILANTSLTRHDWLPFFSKLNFMQHAKQLKMMGAKVTLDRVDVERS